AFNRDLPYDQFLRAQVAGDLLSPDLAAATGFFALGPTYVSDGGDPDAIAQAQSETLDDRVDTLSRGLLGLTASCARCHDHKFDPIPQLDYYSLAGVFNNVRMADHPLVPPETVKAFHDHQRLIQEQEKQIRELDERVKKENRQPTEAEQADRARFDAELNRLRQTAPPMYPVGAVHVLVNNAGIYGNRDKSRPAGFSESSHPILRRRSPGEVVGLIWPRHSRVPKTRSPPGSSSTASG
ncbi:MAG: DUF1549 domain-containing protein, partial [Planctomycetota bacterium]|nr:DUF1549 domain-containing protein [Planctomycetota bacterium]